MLHIDEDFFTYIKTLSPAAIDLEVRSIASSVSLRNFINALIWRLESHRDFEAVQAFEKIFLNIHSEAILADPDVCEDLRNLQVVQKKESKRVLELIASSLGTLNFVRDTL
jgi:U3 small nucleolar RNA-associated protein 21